MNTKQLEAELRLLDERTKTTGNEILSGRNQCAGYRIQAEEFLARADMLINQAYAEEDADQSAKIISQSAECMDQAARYRALADGIESRLKIMGKELLGLRAEYVFYQAEGENNLRTLHEAAEKLMRVSGSRYGGAQISSTLEETKRRIVYNRNLVEGCIKRIAWIDQIGVSSEEPYVKTYSKSR